MTATRPKAFRALLATLFLGVVEVAAIACALTLAQPATAQVIDERFPFLEDRARRNRQQQWGPQSDQPREQQRVQVQGDPSRPPPPTLKPGVTSNVMVFGDQLAEWLAYGLEDAFTETPELGIMRKMRPYTGLIRLETRWENYDWPQQAKEMLAADKPDVVVIMIGLNDRRGIREVRPAPRNPAQKGPPVQQKAAVPAPQGQQPLATPAPTVTPEKPDAEPPPQQDTAQTDDPPANEPALPAGGLVHEFRAEKWGELYGRRIDEMIAALKSRGVPVLWVGLPSIRGARPTTDMVYLNDLFRARAEKAGITYVDVWDGFVDEGGNFNQFGPDFEGQTRRLRTFDGVHFTRPGARKLAHYVEREIRRVLQTRATPMVAIPKDEPEPEVLKGPPGSQQPGKPIASPVMSLTAPPQGGEALLGGGPGPGAAADSIATRVLVRGEAVEAPAGRADDFTWPRRDVATAIGTLPPDPVLPPPVQAIVNPTAPGVGVPPRPVATAPRPTWQQQPVQRQPQDNGWFNWGNPQPQPRDPRQQRTNRWDNQPSFFGNGWFGR